MRGQVQYRGRPIPRPTISPIQPRPGGMDVAAFIAAVAELKQMHVAFLAASDKIEAQVKAIKQGPKGADGASVDFVQLRDAVLKAMPMPDLTAQLKTLAPLVAKHIGTPTLAPEHLATLTAAVVKSMPKIRGKRGKTGKSGAGVATEEILAALKEKGLSPEHLEGMRQTMSAVQNAQRGFRGGGDTVVAGTGVTITNTVNGNKQINAIGGGSSTANEKVTPVQAGSNITLDLTTLTHTFVAILAVYKNGQMLDKDDTQFGWSRAGNTITVLNGFDSDVYYVQYTYA